MRHTRLTWRVRYKALRNRRHFGNQCAYNYRFHEYHVPLGATKKGGGSSGRHRRSNHKVSTIHNFINLLFAIYKIAHTHTHTHTYLNDINSSTYIICVIQYVYIKYSGNIYKMNNQILLIIIIYIRLIERVLQIISKKILILYLFIYNANI